MAMEHRWGKRESVDVEVILDARPHGFTHGRVRNASASGLFVETGARFLLHRRVHVIITLRQGAVTAVHHLLALVTRHAANGVGLAFHEFRPEAVAALRAAARTELGDTARRRALPAAVSALDASRFESDTPAQAYGGSPKN